VESMSVSGESEEEEEEEEIVKSAGRVDPSEM
jgi:hypothetical protein